MSVDSLTDLEQLRSKRSSEVNSLAAFVEKRGGERDAFEKRERSDEKPSDEERSEFAAAEEAFNAEFGERRSGVKSLDRRIDEAEVLEERRKDAARASAGTVSVSSEPLTYRRDNATDMSYFRDLAARFHSSYANESADPAAANERLERHAKEMSVEMPKREREREARAAREIDNAERSFTTGMGSGRGFEQSPFETRVNPNRTDGQGGYLVPPLWLMDPIPVLRAGRVAANLCRSMPLPSGTDSINIPKLATGTATAVQTADNAAVQSTDFTDTSVSAGVKTIAGQQDVAIQLLDQSPGNLVDQVLFEDLMADYNLRLDAQVISGTGSSGQALGILPVSNYTSTNTITWTTSTPTGNGFTQALGAATSKTAYTRYNVQNVAALVHPRRFFWYATALDNISGASAVSGRPVANLPEAAYNTSVTYNGIPEQGLAGQLHFGPHIYMDANMPAVATAAGAISAGTNDLAVVAKWDDLWLFEGEMRTRVLPEILSGTLQVRFQVFNYFAFLVRYGQSISVIQGTGLAAPTAYIDTSITY